MAANKGLGRAWLAGVLAVALVVALANSVSCQRDGDDDFDDSGFDDSGYSSPQNQDTESSNQNPSNYSPANEEDMDDDDDVDETHVSPQVAHEGHQQEQQQQQPIQSGYYDPHQRPQRFYSPANSVLLANIDPQAANHMRYRRSSNGEAEADVEDPRGSLEGQKLVRHKRHSKYIGPVYTYVKTDKYARFKWGVKHKVGKHG